MRGVESGVRMARCLALTAIKDADCDPVVGLRHALHATARGLLLGESPMMKCLEKKMMQRTYGATTQIITVCLLSVAMLTSAVHYNVAQAKSRTAVATACGKELQKQCSGVPVQANNMLACLQKAKLSGRCAALAHNIVRRCDRDAAQLCQGVVRVKATFLDV